MQNNLILPHPEKIKRHAKDRIPISPEFRRTLMEWKAKSGCRSGYIFPSPQNPERCRSWHAKLGFDTAVKRAKLYYIKDDPDSGFVTFHDLRHTFATHFIQRTRDIHTCAKIMGHSTTYMTEKYGGLIDQTALERMREFGGFAHRT